MCTYFDISPVFLKPGLGQRASPGLFGDVQCRVLLLEVVSPNQLVLNDVDNIYHTKNENLSTRFHHKLIRRIKKIPTDDPISEIAAAEFEDVFLVSVVREVVGLYLHGELFNEGTRESRLGVGVGVPGLLLDHEGRLWEQGLEPAGQVTAHVV